MLKFLYILLFCFNTSIAQNNCEKEPLFITFNAGLYEGINKTSPYSGYITTLSLKQKTTNNISYFVHNTTRGLQYQFLKTINVKSLVGGNFKVLLNKKQFITFSPGVSIQLFLTDYINIQNNINFYQNTLDVNLTLTFVLIEYIK